MKDTVCFRPEWLDALGACSAKVQMDIISAIVRWQSEGIMPDFKGMKMALFLFLKADLEKAQAESETETTADSDTTVANAAAPAATRPGHVPTPRHKDRHGQYYPGGIRPAAASAPVATA